MNHRAVTVVLAIALLFGGGARARYSEAEETGKSGAVNEEPLAVIVNTNNPVESVTLEELRKFCLAERKYWPTGRKVTIALFEPGRAERETVLREVYRMNESEFTRHFLQGSFTGQVEASPKELASANGVRRFVFNVPGAIGFVRAGEVGPSEKVLRVDGRKITDPEYKLRVASR